MPVGTTGARALLLLQPDVFFGDRGELVEGRDPAVARVDRRRLEMEYDKPKSIAKKLDIKKQQAFIDLYNKPLNTLDPDEVVMFADAVHPKHMARPVGCWAPENLMFPLPKAAAAIARIFTVRSI
jgi:hypothetical protein